MNTVIIFVVLLATVHFIYDGIILPTIRLHLRNRLFALRDEVRRIMIEEGRKGDDHAFLFVHDGICKFLNRLSSITLHLKIEFQRELSSDQKLQEKVKERIALIESSDNDRLKQIFHETNDIVEKVFIANAGGWFIYLVPLALLAASIKKLSEVASELVVSPTNVTERLIPLHK